MSKLSSSSPALFSLALTLVTLFFPGPIWLVVALSIFNVLLLLLLNCL
jgi:hypothetical protein